MFDPVADDSTEETDWQSFNKMSSVVTILFFFISMSVETHFSGNGIIPFLVEYAVSLLRAFSNHSVYVWLWAGCQRALANCFGKEKP